MSFELPALPWADDALAPHISAETISYHHGKHHAAYVANLNKAVDGSDLEGKSLEEVILASEGGVFNNAAQVWNHTFYWSSLSPDGGGDPSGDLGAAIDAKFGSADDFRAAFKTAATTQFGSGWAWLIKDGGGVDIVQTANADLPLAHGQSALLTIDVWEHAYYIDYRNARPSYIDTYLEELVNWEFAASNFAG
ncbi:MAG: superoxide dismutase [Fe] [Acidimicrobiia bacterium]|nr:superoxide dismutase [Fe] [Acidimicrobiia bacterium]